MACSSTRPDGWSVTIQRLLRLYTTSRQVTCKAPHQNRHPTGRIWRSILAQSIFADLSLGLTVGRRFIRLEYLGLSGVILYEHPSPGRLDPADSNSKPLTLQEVFGDDDDPEDLGMDVDHLLDRVGARLIYAPAYACTSFVVGQVMNALIHSHQMRPIATSHGILVDSDAFTLFDSGPTMPYTPKPTIDVLSYLKPADTCSKMKRTASPSLPFLFPIPFTEVRNDDDQDEDLDTTFDTSISTIDSIGPYTPPHSRSGTPIIVSSESRPSFSAIDPSVEDEVLSNNTNLFDKVLGGATRAIPCKRAARITSLPGGLKEKENCV